MPLATRVFFYELLPGMIEKVRIGSSERVWNLRKVVNKIDNRILCMLYEGVIEQVAGVRWPASGQNREAGANPARTRRCVWGRNPQEATIS